MWGKLWGPREQTEGVQFPTMALRLVWIIGTGNRPEAQGGLGQLVGWELSGLCAPHRARSNGGPAPRQPHSPAIRSRADASTFRLPSSTSFTHLAGPALATATQVCRLGLSATTSDAPGRGPSHWQRGCSVSTLGCGGQGVGLDRPPSTLR